MKLSLLFLLLFLSCTFAKEVAIIDDFVWPKKKEFDEMSRSEILLFYKILKEEYPHKKLSEHLGLKEERIDHSSIKKWLRGVQDKLINLYHLAEKSCSKPTDIACGDTGNNKEFLDFAEKFYDNLDKSYYQWKMTSTKFYRLYAREQIRLAALFPNPTSEIFALNDQEILGDQFNDREFLFTMDDGPEPDKIRSYITLLNSLKFPTLFFVIGDKLSEYIKNSGKQETKILYKGHCLGSHGKVHRAHTKIKEWKESMIFTKNVIRSINGSKTIYFRPPFGMRNPKILSFTRELKTPNMMWNIDSLDWREELTPQQVGLRVIKLMLLWRKGIILFHDDRANGLGAIEKIHTFGKDHSLRWLNCQTLSGLKWHSRQGSNLRPSA